MESFLNEYAAVGAETESSGYVHGVGVGVGVGVFVGVGDAVGVGEFVGVGVAVGVAVGVGVTVGVFVGVGVGVLVGVTVGVGVFVGVGVAVGVGVFVGVAVGVGVFVGVAVGVGVLVGVGVTVGVGVGVFVGVLVGVGVAVGVAVGVGVKVGVLVGVGVGVSVGVGVGVSEGVGVGEFVGVGVAVVMTPSTGAEGPFPAPGETHPARVNAVHAVKEIHAKIFIRLLIYVSAITEDFLTRARPFQIKLLHLKTSVVNLKIQKLKNRQVIDARSARKQKNQSGPLERDEHEDRAIDPGPDWRGDEIRVNAEDDAHDESSHVAFFFSVFDERKSKNTENKSGCHR